MTAVGYSSIFPFLPLYVEDLGSALGVSLELLAGLVFSAQAFMMMLASPFWGAIADRYGRKLMVQRSLYGGTVLLLMMAFVRSAEELVLLATRFTEFSVHVVEVCRTCSWNHLVKSYVLGTPRPAKGTRPARRSGARTASE